jgi:hypothetical protein
VVNEIVMIVIRVNRVELNLSPGIVEIGRIIANAVEKP